MAPFLLYIYLLSIFPNNHLTPFATTKNVDEPAIEELSPIFFSKDDDQIVVKEHFSPNDLAESGLGDPIFIITDKKKKPIGVVKTISIESQEGKSTFSSEVNDLIYLNQIPFKNFHSVKLVGTGETYIQGKKSGLIAEEYAKGFSLNHYLKKISHSKTQSERKKLLSELNQGVEKTALALSELHTYKRFSQPAHAYLLKYDSDSLPGPYGLIHGDTHLGNIFFDAKTKQTLFIDFGSAHFYNQGAPVLQDASNFLFTLEVFSAYYGLSKEESVQLQNSFLSTYQKMVPEASNAALNFYKSYYIKAYASPADWDKDDTPQAKFIHSYCNNIV